MAARGQRCRQRSHSRGSRPHSSALQMSLPPTHPHTKLPANLLALTSYHVAPSHPFAFAPGWLRRPSRAGLGRQAWRVSREHLAVREEMHQPLFTLGEPREDTHCVHLEVKAQTTTIWSSVPACMCVCEGLCKVHACRQASKGKEEEMKFVCVCVCVCVCEKSGAPQVHDYWERQGSRRGP